MSKVFERGNKERLSVTDCVSQVYGRWENGFSIDETCPQFYIKATTDEGEVLGWDSIYFVDSWSAVDNNKFKKVLNEEITRGYIINLTTGEARWKHVLPKKRERYFENKKEEMQCYISVREMVGIKDGANQWEGWSDGGISNIVKVEVIDRDEMPVENVLLALLRSGGMHPAYLRDKYDLPYVTEHSKPSFVEKLTRLTNEVHEDDADDVLAVKLCNMVDFIFQAYNKIGIEMGCAWDDYCHSVKSGSVLRTKDILDYFKEKDREKREERERKRKQS